MALVIFCVDLTDAIRFRSSFSDGIAQRLHAHSLEDRRTAW
jgi:hypothetical protein